LPKKEGSAGHIWAAPAGQRCCHSQRCCHRRLVVSPRYLRVTMKR